MEKAPWRRNHGGAIMEEGSWRRNHGGGIVEGGIMEEKRWRRNDGEGILEAEEPWKRDPVGGIWEATGNHL